MRILIAGGSGSIGKALTRSLVKDGHTVTILSRKPQTSQNNLKGVSFVQWDGRTTDGWGHVINEMDAVINLTGENIGAGRWTKKRKQLILESREKPGQALSAAIQQAKNKPEAFLQVSGVGSYGASESKIFSEESAYGNDFAAGVCKVWEASTQSVEDVGVRRVVTRLAVVLDGQSGALPRMLLPFRFF
ncbi:MAG: epimerase, partial [Chloroflexi bacterium HGW-Chloroflexi-8]